MNKHVPGYPPPGPGFEAPIEMLAACHLRIERQCETLLRLVPHVAANGADRAAQEAAAALIRYFDTAALHHHADEEQDLFPALLESMAGSDATCIRQIVEGLLEQHRQLESLWSAIRSDLLALSAGQAATLAPGLVQQMVFLYRQHLRKEDDELLPMAQRLLSDSQRDQIGRSMRLRRGIDQGPDDV